ncbi:MAG TPA: hypothetical protein VG325_16285 [Solirubrobacteraceae bacterium]|nr:hypothetical protein [Solirubrobacteraceae bacterium]
MITAALLSSARAGYQDRGDDHAAGAITKVIHRRTTEELLGVRWKYLVALSVLLEQPAVSQQSLYDQTAMAPNHRVMFERRIRAREAGIGD